MTSTRGHSGAGAPVFDPREVSGVLFAGSAALFAFIRGLDRRARR